MKSIVKLAIFVLILLPGLSRSQANQKSFNFVDKDTESASGNGMEKLTERAGGLLLKAAPAPGALRFTNSVCMACMTRTKNNSMKTKENFLARLIHSNLAMTFRISRHMNLTFSYS